MNEERHEVYVYKAEWGWAWRCQVCAAVGENYRRRMDADEAAERHEARRDG